MTHIKGQWGTKFNVFFTDNDAELAILQPQLPTLEVRMTHADSKVLGAALLGKPYRTKSGRLLTADELDELIENAEIGGPSTET